MIRRLQHWLDVLPPVEGADIRLMNATDTRQLCAGADLPTTFSLASQVNYIHAVADVSANASADDANCPVMSEDATKSTDEALLPDFPLLPVSRGFHMTLRKLLTQFDSALTAAGITLPPASHSGIIPS